MIRLFYSLLPSSSPIYYTNHNVYFPFFLSFPSFLKNIICTNLDPYDMSQCNVQTFYRIKTLPFHSIPLFFLFRSCASCLFYISLINQHDKKRKKNDQETICINNRSMKKRGKSRERRTYIIPCYD